MLNNDRPISSLHPLSSSPISTPSIIKSCSDVSKVVVSLHVLKVTLEFGDTELTSIWNTTSLNLQKSSTESPHSIAIAVVEIVVAGVGPAVEVVDTVVVGIGVGDGVGVSVVGAKVVSI